MTDNSGDIPGRIEAYLDGLLSGEELRAFEQRLEVDKALRAEVELQRRIDSSLRRAFAPRESAPVFPATPVEPAPLRRATGPWRLLRPIAIAAIIALAVGATWLWWPRAADVSNSASERLMLVEMYERQEQGGWSPDWVCESDEDFARYSDEILGRVVLVRPGPPGVAVTGWKYDRRVFGQRTAHLLARVGDEHALVIIGHGAADRPLQVPTRSGLRLFRRELDGLVLYELTPKAEPAVLDLFYIPVEQTGPDA